MKFTTTLLAIIFSLMSTSLEAQADSIPSEKVSLHAHPLVLGFGPTIAYGFGLMAGGFNRHGWGGSMSINWAHRDAKNLPSDYDGGYGLLGNGADHIGEDRVRYISIRAIKVIPTSSRNILLGLEIGPSIIKTNIADNFIRVQNPCTWDPFFGIKFCAPNYTYKKVQTNVIGLSLKGKVSFRLFNRSSLDLGIMANLNQKWSKIGMEIQYTIGMFEKRHKPPQKKNEK